MSGTFGEFALIDWIRRQSAAHPRVSVGIGDDTAAIRFPAESDCLFAADMLLEGAHFTIPPATPRDVGRKALAVNLSDIAAMAGRPLAAVVSIALPRGTTEHFAHELHRGLLELAQEFDVALAGGDTNTWDGGLVVNVAVIGEAQGTGPVKRSGAQAGDWIFVTGDLGGSLAGKHLSFRPRVEEARRLHEVVNLQAMIDVSDGLAADLHHVLEESRTGAVLRAERIPINSAAAGLDDDKSSLEHALGDGEDFELLFAVSPDDGRRLIENPPFDHLVLTHIGEMTAETGCELRFSDGRREPLPPRGWQHSFD